MILFSISIILLILSLLDIFNYLYFLSKIEKIIALFLIISAYIIFTLEFAGLLNKLNDPVIILSIQVMIFFLIKTTNYLLKNKTNHFNIPAISLTLKKIISKISNNRILFFYSSLILIAYIFLFYLEIRFPQNTTDSMYNHLSRIGYWLQQGSLKTYYGFSNYGTTFPYNNSILMLWSVIFLRTDKLVGLVQYFATFALVITIYLTGKELGFSTKGNVLAALLLLTYPIIIFESITAQNDILVASFLMIAYYFLLKFLHNGNRYVLAFSILGYALALGTKQIALFALPGYIILYVFSIIKNKKYWKSLVTLSIGCTFIFTLLFGSYAYLQNWKNFGSLTGNAQKLERVNIQNVGSLFESIYINSARLSYQFFSCEGIPLKAELFCSRKKAALLRPIITSKLLNVEITSYLLESDDHFILDRVYPLNEESSWFGLNGWLILLPSVLLSLYHIKKTKRPENLLFLVSSLLFSFFTVSFISLKGGWNPYDGRYFIFSVALISPYASIILQGKNIANKVLIFFICGFSIFSMVFCILNNDSRPLVSQDMDTELQIWGMNNSIIVQKIGYKLSPYIRNDLDVWSSDKIIVQTYGKRSYDPVIRMIDKFTYFDSSMGVIAFRGMVPDYYFFSDNFDRKIIPITSIDQLKNLEGKLNFLLVSPDYSLEKFPEFSFISSEGDWKLYGEK